MLAHPAVLLTPSKSSRPTQLLSLQHSARVSPLAATLTNLPASIANKRLTQSLNPLDSTLTKNRGGLAFGPTPILPIWNTLNSRPRAHPSVISASHFLLSNLNC